MKDFTPKRLMRWLQNEKKKYHEANPDAKWFKLHNYRGTAMSRARMAGVSFDDAAVAFGCDPNTMRKHYIALEEQDIADRVMDKIQNETKATYLGEYLCRDDSRSPRSAGAV